MATPINTNGLSRSIIYLLPVAGSRLNATGETKKNENFEIIITFIGNIHASIHMYSIYVENYAGWCHTI